MALPPDSLRRILGRVVDQLAKAGSDPTAAIAAAMVPLAERRWRRASRAALLALLAELQDSLDRTDGTAPAGAAGPAGARLRGLLVAAILADFAGRLTAPLSPDEQDIVREAASTLLGQGAASLDLSLDEAGAAFAEALAAAERDLLAVLSGRLASIEGQVEAIIRDGVAGVLLPSQVEAALRDLMDPGGDAWVGRAVEAWAFRWRNAASVLTARADGVRTLIVLNNPPRGPDARTTPFCRWMHGRTIDVGQAAGQVSRYQQAVLAGDLAGARAVWPLLDRSRLEDAMSFGLIRATTGLPPYHFGCRDILVSG